MARLKNAATGVIVACNVNYAQGWLQRLAGFLSRRTIDPDEGLWFSNCWAIHTLGMRARIDVVFLDREDRVLRAQRGVPRGHPMVACLGARSVVELGAGALKEGVVNRGDRLVLDR